MMKQFTIKAIISCLLICSGLPTSLQAASEAMSLEQSFVKISETVGPAVVTISVVHTIKGRFPKGETGQNPFFDEFFFHFWGQPGREYKQKGLGSGFIISKEGYILTNEHVIGDADEIEVTLPDGRHFQGQFIGSDPRSDIALLKIEGENLPYVQLGDSDRVKPGQWSIAMGNPFGHVVNNPKPTITAGIISAIHRTLNIREADRMYGDLIQTDAAINQGNSGGPLLNLQGEVIGINTLIFSPSGGNVGIGFAIPINRGKSILNDLISGNEIKHGWLGIWLQDVTREIVLQFGLSEEKRGALIFKVEPDSPAEKAGFESGDIILEIDGQPVQNSSDITRIVSGSRPGDQVEFSVFRKKSIKTVTALIGERKETEAQHRKRLEKASEWRGLRVNDITDAVTEKLKLSSKNGVLVSRVDFGSPAHKARIVPGDIIYSIAQHPVKNVNDFIEVTGKLSSGDVLVQTSRGYVVIFEE